MAKSTVYFTKEITPEAVLKMYRQLGVELPGKVAVKVHSGEDGNQNFLRPEFMKPVIDAVHGTVVECNTAYGGARNETPKHVQLMKKHGWSDLFDVDIMDAEGPDVVWPVKNGKVLSENLLGKDIENYDSMLVLIHFKGHPMGGYGGALKQLSIGCASSAGKAYIHSGGKVKDQAVLWENICPQDTFLEAMADAASTVADHFAGKIAYVAVMKNLSVDCDCCAVASILAGWVKPSEGSIQRLNIGKTSWVFQNPIGVARRSVIDHVTLPYLARGLDVPQAEACARELLAQFGLAERASSEYRELSGGEAQRLMLARGVASGADLLLVDEPTAQLDVHTADTVNARLGALSRQGMIVVVATHDHRTRDAATDVIDLEDYQ